MIDPDQNKYCAEWKHPTQILFGPGRIKELSLVCYKLGIKHPLLVTDHGLSENPIILDVLRRNRDEGVITGFFFDITSNPSYEQILAGIKAFKKSEHDGIIAIGGGSVLDAAKAICLAVSADTKDIWNFRWNHSHRYAEIPANVVPIIAVPSTAGTGSEVNANAVICNPNDGSKTSIFHPSLMPKTVIADPDLLRDLPLPLRVSTGIDAFSHNLEAYLSPTFNPMLDGVSLRGMQLIKRWLPPSCEENAQDESRIFMLAASIMGALAFEKGLGAIHAVAHAIGSLYNTHHGETIAAVTPYVLRFNQKAIEEKFKQIVFALELEDGRTEVFVEWFSKFKGQLGLRKSVDQLGASDDDIPQLTELALDDGNVETNPIPLNRKNMEELIRSCFEKR